MHLRTRRNADAFPGDCPQPPPAGWPGCQVQNLHYTYDPAGNITHIRDDAQQTIYFKNRRVEPSAEYTYDAIYRLIEATGREHLGQVGGAPIPHSYNDTGRVPIASSDAAGAFAPNDGNAMGRYLSATSTTPSATFCRCSIAAPTRRTPAGPAPTPINEPSLLEPGQDRATA